MKQLLSLIFLCSSLFCLADDTDTLSQNTGSRSVAGHRATMLDLGVGFGDYYRAHPEFGMPAGFHSGNITGFIPLSARIEYGLNERFVLAGSLYTDHFQYNYYQDFASQNGTYSRYMTNKFNLFGVGVSAVYYPVLKVQVPNLEPFLQIGLSLNNLQYSGVPQGDSTVSATTHRVSPVIRIGGRYYFSKARNAGIYLELGFDRQSVVNFGVSAKLVRKKGRHMRL
jgi:hypothetical protein